jgi:hypothetical protein
MKDNLMLGRAGELRVASELLLRGIEVYLNTSADSGVDLILSNSKKVQVKTARLTTNRQPTWRSYCWSFKSWRRVEKHYESHSLKDVDYVILWAVDDDVFFIIPADEVRGSYSIRLNPGSSYPSKKVSNHMRFKDAWDSLKA